MVRALLRHIVDSVAEGQKYHLKIVFSDNRTYHSTRLGDPEVTNLPDGLDVRAIENRSYHYR